MKKSENSLAKNAKKARNASSLKAVKSIALSFISGNLFDTIKEAISNTIPVIRGQRILNLVNNVCNNKQEDIDHLLLILSNQEHELHEIIMSVIIKTVDESNIIKRNLLAKIMLYYIKHQKFDDFHEMLFNNLNFFITSDFSNLLEIDRRIRSDEIKKHPELGCYMYSVTNNDFSTLNTILKLINIQIFQEYIGSQGFHSGIPETNRTGVCFFIFEDKFAQLVGYLLHQD